MYAVELVHSPALSLEELEPFDDGNSCWLTTAQGKIRFQSCQIQMKASNCDRRPLSPALRDCKTEATHPLEINNFYNILRGCLSGLYGATLGSVVATLESGWTEAEFQARYFGPEVRTACVSREQSIAKARAQGIEPSANDLSVVQKCKDRLVENFPEVQKQYPNGLQQIAYDDLLNSVHSQIRQIQANRPSLQKFIQEHPDNFKEAAAQVVKDQLSTWKIELACYNAEARARLECTALAVAIGTVLSTENSVAKILREAGAAADVADSAGVVSMAGRTRKVITTPPPRSIAATSNPQLEIWRWAKSGAKRRAAQMRQKIEDDLKGSPIKSSEDIRTDYELSTNPQLVTLENGLQGVWKADGAREEIAAYKIDQRLGSNMVPITVEKDVNGVKGSLQLFVADKDKTGLELEPDYLCWFDELLNNGDRHGGNYLTIKGQVVAIDHEKAFSLGSGATDYDLGDRLQDTIKPYQRSQKVVKSLQQIAEDAAKKDGTDSLAYKVATRKLVEAQNRQKELQVITQNKLGILLPDYQVYANLKSVSDGDWESILHEYLPPDQITGFLQRRNYVVNVIEKIEKTFGRNAFRSGPVSPLLREDRQSIEDWDD